MDLAQQLFGKVFFVVLGQLGIDTVLSWGYLVVRVYFFLGEGLAVVDCLV